VIGLRLFCGGSTLNEISQTSLIGEKSSSTIFISSTKTITAKNPHSKTRSMSLAGKVYTVTGGASGIGLATARLIAERGGIVSISDIDEAGLQVVEAEFASEGWTVMTTKVDVSKRDEVEAWIDSTIAKYGRLDGAANVAGYIGKDHGVKSVAQQDDGEWDKIMAVNLTGTMYCMRAQLGRMGDAGGSIVNVSSIHGIRGTTPLS
jgi:NAD(P)-dependent dehydrogenase (short-subunit alcohol dehydrogenase family)